ncbi:MAG: OsmC family protein [Hyphomicrobiales bacterium]|nr:OsmC family protein [Hyphomicrobiales bacterium]
MKTTTQRIEFIGSNGHKISAKLDLPSGEVKAYALFAHCFTCTKDINATKRIAIELAKQSIAVLRFDFAGLGASEGEFAATNFSSNIEDLLAAADFLREYYKAPQIVIGHSLGGAAALPSAALIPESNAVVTIGAPADAEHVVHNFGEKIAEINYAGEAEVNLAGRIFSIRQQFLDDLKSVSVTERARNLKKALLVMHSPVDATVGIENAQEIFIAARHPKSFVSLDNADHLLSAPKDAEFAASVIATWSSRYLEIEADSEISPDNAPVPGVQVIETGKGKFHNVAKAGTHQIIADEPTSVGGSDKGPTPYDFLSIALGACTNMTMRMYADFKKLDIGKISVQVNHNKIYTRDCQECSKEEKSSGGKIDRFERTIHIEGLDDAELEAKMLVIADKCPVHRTLDHSAKIITHYKN